MPYTFTLFFGVSGMYVKGIPQTSISFFSNQKLLFEMQFKSNPPLINQLIGAQGTRG
ncbi:hypothetical protein G9A89_020666 [Geosiphon pyriformis]|nr:hypothetical protein G9A89_020666 [Geosiphon pyriformis]